MNATIRTAPSEITPAARKAVLAWLISSLAVFTVMIVLGILMRLSQGGVLQIQPGTFYSMMTMHGLGMAGSLFSVGLAMLWWSMASHCNPNVRVMWSALALFLLGAVGLLVATLQGGFAAGWYALYPLPFVKAGWPSWSIGLAIISLMVLGVAWLMVQLDLLRAMSTRFGFKNLLGWGYLRGKPGKDLPAPVLITTVCTIAGTLGVLVGAATLVMYLIRWLTPSADFDALTLKNMMFMFGHTIVNVAMYCAVCIVYHVLPRFTGRPWKLNRVTVLAWNATLIFILFAYFHHLYMDFAQNVGLQYLGQIASYASAVPATAVTIFGVGSQIYRSGIRWSFVPVTFVAAMVGWLIGGFTAVLDSTIALNNVFHNTLWVPGHFHTYFLVGMVLIMLGFAHYILRSRAERLAGWGLAAMMGGGYTFLLMFFMGGLSSVPRRYASYRAIPVPSVAEDGTAFATYAAIAAMVFLAGALIFFVSLAIGRRGSRAEAELAGTSEAIG